MNLLVVLSIMTLSVLSAPNILPTWTTRELVSKNINRVEGKTICVLTGADVSCRGQPCPFSNFLFYNPPSDDLARSDFGMKGQFYYIQLQGISPSEAQSIQFSRDTFEFTSNGDFWSSSDGINTMNSLKAMTRLNLSSGAWFYPQTGDVLGKSYLFFSQESYTSFSESQSDWNVKFLMYIVTFGQGLGADFSLSLNVLYGSDMSQVGGAVVNSLQSDIAMYVLVDEAVPVKYCMTSDEDVTCQTIQPCDNMGNIQLYEAPDATTGFSVGNVGLMQTAWALLDEGINAEEVNFDPTTRSFNPEICRNTSSACYQGTQDLAQGVGAMQWNLIPIVDQGVFLIRISDNFAIPLSVVYDDNTFNDGYFVLQITSVNPLTAKWRPLMLCQNGWTTKGLCPGDVQGPNGTYSTPAPPATAAIKTKSSASTFSASLLLALLIIALSA